MSAACCARDHLALGEHQLKGAPYRVENAGALTENSPMIWRCNAS